MVDEPRVRRLLQRIGDDLALLADRAREDRDQLRADVDRLAAESLGRAAGFRNLLVHEYATV